MLLQFKANFESDIACGAKRQTIRTPRTKRPILPGDKLHLYVGARTKDARCIGIADCLSVTPLELRFKGYSCNQNDGYRLNFGPWRSNAPGLDAFARLDGFADWAALRAWFVSVHSGGGNFVLIAWHNFRAPEHA